MKSVRGKKTLNINKLIIVLLIIVLGMGTLPNTTYATTDTDGGGTIFDPIMKFITFLCDSVMQFMQNSFTSNQSISNGDGTYTYQYSPAIIFSGTVQGLDINFITPNTDVRNTNNYRAFVKENQQEYSDSATKKTKEEYEELENKIKEKHPNYQVIIEESTSVRNKSSRTSTTKIYFYEIDNGENKKLQIEYFKETKARSLYSYYYSSTEHIVDNAFLTQMNATTTYTSIAYELQPTIATWYNALKRISLVGLLSVLLYVGIRIILTSVAGKENSKYKKMLIDWLVALCLLFTLHYIMNLTLVVTKELSNVFNIGTEDALIGDIRTRIDTEASSWGEATTLVIMYVVLTIYTVIFTFQYLKRVLYMAFFTLIAPLITLTYPIDKIKDGKAQAFTMWIREYIFNALIQVIHLIVYYVLVESALSLVKLYPIYAIVAIGFMTQAEKIVRSMFGFNNAETVGTIGAAATGGLISSAMNKLKGLPKIPKGGKESSAGEVSNNNVRTASGDPLSALKGKGEEPTPGGVPGTNNNGKQGNSGAGGVGESQQTPTKPKKSIKGVLKTGAKGAGALLKRYHRQVLGGAAGVFIGGTGAMIGLAAGISQGDLGAAAAGLMAGGKAGYGLGGRVYNGAFDTPGNIRNALNNLGDTWNEGAYGEEYASNVKFDREFRRSSAYKALRQKYGDNFSDTDIQAMLEAGITEKGAMDKILKNVTDGNRYNIKDAIGYYTLAKKCPDSLYYDDSKFTKWLQDQQGLSQQDAEELRNNMKNFR